MKKIKLTFICLLIILSTSLNQEWQIVNESITGNINHIDFINEDKGWMAGYGSLLKTVNGGNSWDLIPLDVSWNISMIEFINDSIGWIIGSEYEGGVSTNMILKTTDGGYTWGSKYELIGSYFHSIYALGDSFACAIGDGEYGPLILKTLDGGNEWSDISPDTNCYLYSVWFFNPNIGIVTGRYRDNDENNGIILRTFDGGNTWEINIYEDLGSIDDLYFINDSTGYFLSWDNYNNSYYLCETIDTCKSWFVKITNNCWIRSFFILTTDTLYINILDSLYTNHLFYSTNGGANMEEIFSPGWELIKMFFSKDNVGHLLCIVPSWGMGPSLGTSYINNNNFEKEWRIKRIISYPFKDLHFFDEIRGVIVGGAEGLHYSAGDIFTTFDGGNSWQHVVANCPEVSSVEFVDLSTGYALSLSQFFGSTIYKTLNAGESWNPVFEGMVDNLIPTTFFGNDMSFINENIGWVVGWANSSSFQGAAILRTTNGGNKWNISWNDTIAYQLNSIFFLDENTGWAVGDDGLIVKYLQGNLWQVQRPFTDLPLYKVYFIDQIRGLIAGGYFYRGEEHLILFNTTDGGGTWQEIPDFIYQINDIYFTDNLHGWAVGNDTSFTGIILETQNGGNNWYVQFENFGAPLHALHINDGLGWAVGEKGLILRYDGISWIDDKNNRIYPDKFILFQNYPNPFNSNTVISYYLPNTSKVKLSIYNLLGQEITNLVSAKQSAGLYKVEWDASGYASGIYYFRLETDNGFIKAKKLVFLK